jgi:hypothetical protein
VPGSEPGVLRAKEGVVNRTCELDGCGYPHEARGLCRRHYMQQRRSGRLAARGPREVFRDDCEACGRESLARGRWCWDCYRQRAYGKVAS